MLASIIEGVKENGQMCGVVPHIFEDALSILQYANFFYDFKQISGVVVIHHDLEECNNLNLDTL